MLTRVLALKNKEIYIVLKHLKPVEFNNHTAKFYYNISLKTRSARLYISIDKHCFCIYNLLNLIFFTMFTLN